MNSTTEGLAAKMGARTNSLEDFKKINSGDKNLDKVQQNVQNSIQPIIRKEIVDGVLLKNICLEPGISNEIKHGLGRSPQGWSIARKRADSRIWDIQDFNPNPSRTLSITCSHLVTVDIWIY